ncbi:MAG: hypothetical protein K2N84_05590, partial [Clostridia bacterium]|nr:hypothetical protein [Clostridia bacterium]
MQTNNSPVSIEGGLICLDNHNKSKLSNYGLHCNPNFDSSKLVVKKYVLDGQAIQVGIHINKTLSNTQQYDIFQYTAGNPPIWPGTYFIPDDGNQYSFQGNATTKTVNLYYKAAGLNPGDVAWRYLEEVNGVATWKDPGSETVGSYSVTKNTLTLDYNPNRRIIGIWAKYVSDKNATWNYAQGDGVAANPPADSSYTAGAQFVNYSDTLGGTTFTYAQEPGKYTLLFDHSCAQFSSSSNYLRNSAFSIVIKPIDVTVTMNTGATLTYGDKLELGALPSTAGSADLAKKVATANNGVDVGDLGLIFAKSYGTDAGSKNVIAPIGWTNKKYNVTFMGNATFAGVGTYTIGKRDVTVVLNDDYITYGASTAKEANVAKTALNGTSSIITSTKNDSTKFKDTDNKDVTITTPATGVKADAYKGGWYYSTDVGAGKASLQFINPDTNSGADLSKIFEYEITDYAAATDKDAADTDGFLNVKKYTVSVKNINKNYNVTFINAQTGKSGTNPNEGTFIYEVRKADLGASLSASTTTPKYDEAANDGTAQTITLPTDTITKQGYSGASLTMKYLVYGASDTIPTNLADANSANWADETKVTEWATASATATKTDAGTYTVFTRVENSNHNAKVYKWTFTIGANKVKYRLVIKYKDNGVDKVLQPVSGLLQQAYKKGSAVTVSVQYEWDWDGGDPTKKPTAWDADVLAGKGPDVKIYYLGTDTDNKHGAAAGDGVTYPDESKKADGTTAAGLGSLTA